jgi:hypothetical protein
LALCPDGASAHLDSLCAARWTTKESSPCKAELSPGNAPFAEQPFPSLQPEELVNARSTRQNCKRKTFGGAAVKKPLSGWMLCCILSIATFAFGQTATTSLRGVVKDSSAALVPGASVTLTDQATGNTYRAAWNSAG